MGERGSRPNRPGRDEEVVAQITRVFVRRGSRKRSNITISLSLPTEEMAQRLARRLDEIKAKAALDGETYSVRIAKLLQKETEK